MNLSTDRLHLRPFRDDDFAALRALVADPRVFQYRSRSAITEDQTRAFLAHAQQAMRQTPAPLHAFALILRTTSHLIGECGLTRLIDQADVAFLWYTLSPPYWNQGYMTEAARAVVQFGFTRGGFQRIVADCHPDNRASRRILERLGMIQRDAPPTPLGVPPNHQPWLSYEVAQTEWLDR